MAGALVTPLPVVAAATPPQQAPRAAAADATPTLTDLGVTSSFYGIGLTAGMNNKGQIAGWLPTGATLFAKGSTKDLHALLGIGEASSSAAWDVNDAGTVVGQYTRRTPGKPGEVAGSFVYHADSELMEMVDGLAEARSVNDRGQVAGDDWIRDPDGSVLRLGPEKNKVEVTSLNNAGQAVGVVDVGGLLTAFRTRPGEPLNTKRDILAAPPGTSNSMAHHINGSGVVAGYAKVPGYPNGSGYVPVIWDKDGVPQRQGTSGGEVFGLNEAGVGVGYKWVPDPASGGVYLKRLAVMFEGGMDSDLNQLLPADTGFELREATGINEFGQISGLMESKADHKAHVFLLDMGENAPPVVDSVKLETKRYPDGAWAERGSLIDGTPARVVLSVTNPGSRPIAAEIRLSQAPKPGDAVPGAPLTGGEKSVALKLEAKETTKVAVNWDTAGIAWEEGEANLERYVKARIYVGGVQEGFAESGSITTNPKPVVLVHGWRSDADQAFRYTPVILKKVHPNLEAFAVGDGKFGVDGGALNTGDADVPELQTYTLERNAAEAAKYIENVRKRTGAWQVDVVAHSMGGLIVRQMIQDDMPVLSNGKPVVNRMLQMGTPNQGATCADLLVRLGALGKIPSMPATREVTTGYVKREFNPVYTDLKGVAASNLGGVGTPVPCQWPLEDGDSIIPRWSAEWFFDTPRTETLHTSMTSSEWDFQNYVKRRLASVPGRLGDPSQPGSWETMKAAGDTASKAALTATATAADAGTDDASVFAAPSASVEPGKTVSVPVDVPQGKAFGVAGVLPSTTGLLLRDPSGKERASYAAGSDTAKEPVQGLAVAGAQAGSWTVEFTNTGEKPVQADVAAWVTGTPVTVSVKADKPSEDGRVKVTGTVTDGGQPVTGVPVKAALIADDNSRHELTLHDDGNSGDGAAGDGVYAATSDPLSDGGYAVTVRADTAQGVRTASDVVEVKKPDLREFALELSAQRGGSVSASPAQEAYRSGTVVTLTPTADAGRMPLGWIVDGEERPGGVLKLTMDGPHTVVARFGSYTVSEIGGLSGGSSTAEALNDAGQVAATAVKDGKRRVVRWQAGGVTDLGTLLCSDEGSNSANDCEAAASGINEAGDVSGWSFTTVEGRNEQHAVVYGADGSVKDLTPAGKQGTALDLNDNGQIFGTMCSESICPHPYVMWDGGAAAGLPSEPEFDWYPGDEPAGRINARGAVAGGYVTDSIASGAVNWSPAVYQDGLITKLEIPDCWQEGGVAHDVNNSGVVAGEGTCNDGTSVTHSAYLWKDGRRSDLGAGSATAINDSGLVAGMAGEPAVAVPALWLDGKQYKLADLLPLPLCPADEAKTTQPCIGLKTLVDVNSSGQILAQGFVRDRSATSAGFDTSGRSFLLTPTTDQADLQVTTEVSAAEPGPASTVTWTATVVNKGPDPATDVRLDVLVPRALAGTAACDTWRGKCTPIKEGFRNTVKVLEPGWEAKVEISATVPADMADGTELKVQAEGYSPAVADPQPDNDAAVATATVRPLLDKTGVIWTDSVKVGSTSDPVTVTLTNRLNAPIPLKAIGVEGPFAQSNTCPVELPVGDKCTVTLTFSPTADGAASGKLTFTTADGAAPAYTVTLSGTGTANVNAKPVVQVPATPLRGTVGKPFTLSVDFTDADTSDTHSAQVLWGSGGPVPAQVDQRPGGGTVTATKTFTGPTSGMAVVMVSDGKETTWQGVPYVIEDAAPNTAPVVSVGPNAEVSIGEQFGRWASFADDDSASWTATVDYGDGTGPQPQPLEVWQIPLSHKWAAAGTYTVTVKVKDDGGLEGTARFTVTVLSAETPNQAPKVTLLGYD
ncbi:choice-of-anchor X domain-containing protein, partial [Microbispora triticiradicis]|uniref:choice-of-anchor X domain-containing protein n=1 Tax=Microbispora triticiradicis TaxID=2200763 RepID=UPI001FCCE57C